MIKAQLLAVGSTAGLCPALDTENDMDHLIDDADRLPELPPEGHPLRTLGQRLAELLDEDQWAECERLLLEGWEYDRLDRKNGAAWRENSSLEVWFPFTAEAIVAARQAMKDACADLAGCAADPEDAAEPIRRLTDAMQALA